MGNIKSNKHITELISILRNIDSGLIINQSHNNVLKSLSEAWVALTGSDAQRTSSDKLYRAEALSWEKPILSFILERHGGTVNGSTRAELHRWEVDLEKLSASIVKVGYRQLTPKDKPFKVKQKAEEVIKLILGGNDHEYLQWEKDGHHVIIKISLVVPETIAQTTTARRKRFRNILTELMSEQGWDRYDKGNRIGFICEK